MEKQLKETKEERFVRVAEARTNKLIHMIRLMGNLSSRNYEYSMRWIAQIFSALREELDASEKKLLERNGEKSKKRFSLKEDPFEFGETNSSTSSALVHWVYDSPISYYCSACGTVGKDCRPDDEDRFCRYCGKEIEGPVEYRYAHPKEVES